MRLTRFATALHFASIPAASYAATIPAGTYEVTSTNSGTLTGTITSTAQNTVSSVYRAGCKGCARKGARR